MTIHNLTPKQEQFCQKYIESGNVSEAYRQAYAGNMKSETIHRNACALLENSKVATRIADLQAGHRQHHDVTIDLITAELDEARQLALRLENPAAAVSAIIGKAKLHGLISNKIEVKAERMPKEEITLHEVARRIISKLMEVQMEAKEHSNNGSNFSASMMN